MNALLNDIRARGQAGVEQMRLALELAATVELDSRRQLLSIAGRGLNHPELAARWLELAAAETDPGLRAGMIVRAATFEPRRLPDPGALGRLLVAGLALEGARSAVIPALERLLLDLPELTPALMSAWRELADPQARDALLRALARLTPAPPALAECFTEALDESGTELRPLLVDRLLRARALDAERLRALLRADEPVPVRRRVLAHLLDLGHGFDEVLVEVLGHDPDPECRAMAVAALAGRGLATREAAAAVLRAMAADPEPALRAAASQCFAQAFAADPGAIDAVLAILAGETDLGLAGFLLELLLPHAGRSEAVRRGLVAYLGSNVDAGLAARAYAGLGRLALIDNAWTDFLAQAFGREGNARVRAAIVRSLAGVPDPDGRLTPLYRAALAAPEAPVRQWGLKGIVLLPLDAARCEEVAAIACEHLDLLLDWDLDRELREALVRKLARIPNKSPALLSALARLARENPSELADCARAALDRAALLQDEQAPDWEAWYRRVEVDKDARGLMPQIFIHYDANPETARRILRAALAPDFEFELPMHFPMALGFLIEKDAFDDELSRMCISRLQEGSESRRELLAALKSNPDFPGLLDSLWRLLERGAHGSEWELMGELLLLGHGGEPDALAQALARRLAALMGAEAAEPYLGFLAKFDWPQLRPAAEAALARPALHASESNRYFLAEICRRHRLSMPVTKQGPGLADD